MNGELNKIIEFYNVLATVLGQYEVDEDEVRKEKAVLSFYEEEDYEKDGIRRGDPGLDLNEKEVDPEDPLKDPRRFL